jgi:hypothetical protein
MATSTLPRETEETTVAAVAQDSRVPWTRALKVCCAGFLIWLLLDAPTLQHNAQVSPVGTRRSVSMDILGPIAAVSRGLGLSHVVSVADGIIGRNGNMPGNGSVEVVGPSTTQRAVEAPWVGRVPVTPPTTTPSGPPVPTAANPLRVLMVGDSLGIDLGDTLVNDLANTGVVQATLDATESTGLTRPDYYNWPAELQNDLAKYNPQLVVVMIGANDPQDFPGPPDVPYGTGQWDATYAQRVKAFMAEGTSDGARVVWVGMPPMADPGRSAAMAHLDDLDQQAASATANVTFLSSWTVLGTPQGAYTPYVTNGAGQEIHVREPDGTHIAPGGAELLSQSVIAVMRSTLHIALPA